MKTDVKNQTHVCDKKEITMEIYALLTALESAGRMKYYAKDTLMNEDVRHPILVHPEEPTPKETTSEVYALVTALLIANTIKSCALAKKIVMVV